MREFVYWFLLFAILGISVIMSILAYHQKRRLMASLSASVMFAFILFSLSSAWWYLRGASDDFSQLMGLIYYGIAWVVSGVINAAVLMLQRKRH